MTDTPETNTVFSHLTPAAPPLLRRAAEPLFDMDDHKQKIIKYIHENKFETLNVISLSDFR